MHRHHRVEILDEADQPICTAVFPIKEADVLPELDRIGLVEQVEVLVLIKRA